MRKERRYTEGQENLLHKIGHTELDEQEQELLRRVLLPRKKYLPQSDAEGREIALQMLKEEKYNLLFSFIGELRARYGELDCRWTRGDRAWDLFYSVRSGGKVLCRFGLSFDTFDLIICFGKKECERFEKEREFYPRDLVQWPYDMAPMEQGRKNISFDISDPAIYSYLFRLLSYKK